MLLEVENLTKRFGGLTAVNELSFGVEEKAILSVIGPNGAGKSTLFKLITSFERPNRGACVSTARTSRHSGRTWWRARAWCGRFRKTRSSRR